MKSMFRYWRLVAIVGLALVLVSSSLTAFADSPHFIRASANLSGNNLVVTFKEAGLGNTTVTEVASAFATATYECINGGGNHPKASNKETVSSQVSASGSFTPGNTGTISGSLTISPPGPGNFSCPSGQTLVGPIDVSYTGVTVTDTKFGDSISIPGTF